MQWFTCWAAWDLMERFRFHLLSSDRLFPDDTGAEFAGYEDALAEGYRAAREMAQEIEASGGNPAEYALRVEAMNGVGLADIDFSEALPPSVPIGHALTSEGGAFLDVDDTFCEILQRTRAEVCSGDILGFTDPDDRFRNGDSLARLLSTGRPFSIRKRYLRPDRSWAWVENDVSLFRDGAGGERLIAAVRLLLPHEAAWEAEVKQGGLPGRLGKAALEAERRQARLRLETSRRLEKASRLHGA